MTVILTAMKLKRKSIDEAIREIGQAISEGIKTIKLKVGANDKNEMDLLKEIRRQFGWEDVILRVDANQAYDLADGIRILHRMAEYNLHLRPMPLTMLMTSYLTGKCPDLLMKLPRHL